MFKVWSAICSWDAILLDSKELIVKVLSRPVMCVVMSVWHSLVAMEVPRMPSLRNVSSIVFAKISLPMAPDRDTCAPQRAAAIACNVALPPGVSVVEFADIVFSQVFRAQSVYVRISIQI